MRPKTIVFERLPNRTHANKAFRYLVGFTPTDTTEWWSDFVVKEITADRESAVAHAERLRELLSKGQRFVPELDLTRLWHVCITDIYQPGKQFDESE